MANQNKTSNGFPGLRRSANALNPSDSLDGSQLAFLAPAPVVKNILPASQTFLRDNTPRRFGNKAAQRAARRSAAALLGRGIIRSVPYLGTAYLLYEGYEYLREGSAGLPIPRDPDVRSDNELSFPAGWSVSVTRWVSPHPYDPEYDAGAHRWWYTDPSGSRYANGMDFRDGESALGPYDTAYDMALASTYYVPKTAADIAGTVPPIGHQFLETRRYDAEAGFPDYVGTATIASYYRTGGADAPVEFLNPQRLTPSVPPIITTITIEAPLPYREIPNRRPNPFLSPHEQPQWGPEGPWRPVAPLSAPISPHVAVPPDIVVGVPAPPVPAVITLPGGTTVVPSLPSVPAPPREPPGRGERERKIRVRRNGVVQAVRGVVGQVTEFLDALDAFYGALPLHLRPGYYPLHRADGTVFYIKRWNPSVRQRAEAVYRHFDQLDLNRLVYNVARNEVGDRLIGSAAQRLGETAHTAGLNRTVLFGPWDTAYTEFWLTGGGG